MKALERLFLVEPVWAGVTATLLAIVTLLILRRFLPPSQRQRGKIALFFLLLALVLRLSATTALQSGFYTLWGLLSFLDILSVILGLIGLTSLLVFDLVLNRTHVRVPSILQNLIKTGIVFAIVVFLLYQRGFDPLSLVSTSAVLTAVIGLALQNTIANVFAGLSLQIDRTFRIGDWIQVGTTVGRIAEIKWRATSLWTNDGDWVIVPNGQLVGAEVLNFLRPNPKHRMWVRVGFHYRHPPNEVKRVLVDAVRDTPGVLSEPSPDCVVLDFADSAVLYALRYWITDFTSRVNIESEVRTRVWYAARHAGLEIPFPIRTLVMPSLEARGVGAGQNNGLPDRLAILAQTELFAGLGQKARESLAAGMRTVRFGAGENILRINDCSSALYLVQNGVVSVYVTIDGSRREVTTLTAGEVFGELALMNGEARQTGYAAKSDTECYMIDHATLGQLLTSRPKLAEDLSAMLAAREMLLDSERQGLSAEAQARRAAEVKSRLLARIQRVFALKREDSMTEPSFMNQT